MGCFVFWQWGYGLGLGLLGCDDCDGVFGWCVGGVGYVVYDVIKVNFFVCR